MDAIPICYLPQEICFVIIDSAIEKEQTLEDKITAAAHLRLINKEFQEYIDNKFHLKLEWENLRRDQLINKYATNSYPGFLGMNEVHVPFALFDALSTGCPYVRHSLENFDDQVERDIKDIIKLMPCSLKWNFGQTSSIMRMSPLLIGCLNSKIPLRIIRFILDQGESPYQLQPRKNDIIVFGSEGTWTQLILACHFYPENQVGERHQKLVELFEEYVGKKNSSGKT